MLASVGLVALSTPSVPARAADDTLTLVDWNLHYGVSPVTGVDLESIAATIEAQDADVVTLQEVERGWIFGGGADMATWLSRRLGMTIQFAPAADRQFGNAVLSRSSLTDVAIHELPYGDGPQDRSALATTLTTASGHVAPRDVGPPAAPRVEHPDPPVAADRAGGRGAGDATRPARRRLQRHARLPRDHRSSPTRAGSARSTPPATRTR